MRIALLIISYFWLNIIPKTTFGQKPDTIQNMLLYWDSHTFFIDTIASARCVDTSLRILEARDLKSWASNKMNVYNAKIKFCQFINIYKKEFDFSYTKILPTRKVALTPKWGINIHQIFYPKRLLEAESKGKAIEILDMPKESITERLRLKLNALHFIILTSKIENTSMVKLEYSIAANNIANKGLNYCFETKEKCDSIRQARDNKPFIHYSQGKIPSMNRCNKHYPYAYKGDYVEFFCNSDKNNFYKEYSEKYVLSNLLMPRDTRLQKINQCFFVADIQASASNHDFFWQAKNIILRKGSFFQQNEESIQIKDMLPYWYSTAEGTNGVSLNLLAAMCVQKTKTDSVLLSTATKLFLLPEKDTVLSLKAGVDYSFKSLLIKINNIKKYLPHGYKKSISIADCDIFYNGKPLAQKIVLQVGSYFKIGDLELQVHEIDFKINVLYFKTKCVPN